MAGTNIIGSSCRQVAQVSAMMPSLDQKPPMRGMPMIDIDPNIIAVAVTGILAANPPMIRMSCGSKAEGSSPSWLLYLRLSSRTWSWA